MLDIGANVNVLDATDKTPLHVAASEARSDAEILKLLLDAGADINARTTGGETPVMKAIFFGRNHAL